MATVRYGEFEWDPTKAARNLQKHRVSFEEAVTVFSDPLARLYPDPDHSDDEDRAILVGHSHRSRILLVVHVERTHAIRIISARTANRRERSAYANEASE